MAGAADLPAEMLQIIQGFLHFIDYFRFAAVCTSWRAAAKRNPNPSVDCKSPWLFSLRCLHESYSAVAVRICPASDGPPQAAVVFQKEIPKGFRNAYLVNSLDNHIILADRSACTLVNPLSPSWPVLARFPSRFRQWGIAHPISKVAAPLPFTHRSVAVGLAGRFRPLLVFAMKGTNHWTTRGGLTRCGAFQDLILRKRDGLFYALSMLADKVFVLGFSVVAARGRSRVDDLSMHEVTYDLVADCDPVAEAEDGWRCFQRAQLVDSASGLFLVRWRMMLKIGETRRREVDVYKLCSEERKWARVDSLDGYSFFLGSKQSLALSTADFPELPSDRIYIPSDADVEMVEGLVDIGPYLNDTEHNLIYNLPSKTWEQWDPLYGPKDTIIVGGIWPVMWLAPPQPSSGVE